MRDPRRTAAIIASLIVVALAVAVGIIWMTGRAASASVTLRDPVKREIAMEIMTSAENSALDWYNRYDYLEDIGDDRGYTGGLVGFTSGTHDMLMLVERYTDASPENPLAPFLPALRAVDGSASHEGLGESFEDAWASAAEDPAFRQAQRDEVDRLYFEPAVVQALADGLGVLGQFIYFDAMVMHGDSGFAEIRARARDAAHDPAEGGGEVAYLEAFLDARVVAMKQEEAHEDTSRVDTAQREFLAAGNLALDPPLRWAVYGDAYEIDGDPTPRW